ncbi:hypothetical protein ACR6C2_08260 [Streptomyces sp. INA 01156]
MLDKVIEAVRRRPAARPTPPMCGPGCTGSPRPSTTDSRPPREATASCCSRSSADSGSSS